VSIIGGPAKPASAGVPLVPCTYKRPGHGAVGGSNQVRLANASPAVRWDKQVLLPAVKLDWP
jgi:hypothetical protein